jgi:hypothetical protein
MRLHFPLVFARRCEQCRKYGAKLVIIGREKLPDGRYKNIRCYPDEVPLDQSTVVKAADFGGCGFHCPTEAEWHDL